jgi:cell filamentation protein
MYQADPDPYCYPGSDIQKNKANLRNQNALDNFETAMTFARAQEPLPAGRFSVSHYYKIHHHLFQDVYKWAGKPRKVRLEKGGSHFCYPENIKREMTRIFTELKEQKFLLGLSGEEFAAKSAHFLTELNAVHPFREGNGRAQNSFFVMLGISAGHAVDLDRLNPQEMLAAMIASFQGNEEPLAAILHELVR